MTTTTVKTRPIIFTGPMVRAILDGRKTQTRRVVKYIPMLGDPLAWCAAARAQEPGWVHIVGDYRRFCPYGVPGDRLWVRETWVTAGPRKNGDINEVQYRADEDDKGTTWTSPIFMPRWASRITLEVTAVRVERLGEITRADIIAEGSPNPPGPQPLTAYHSWYRKVWEEISGDGICALNPWVWVIEFLRVRPAPCTP